MNSCSTMMDIFSRKALINVLERIQRKTSVHAALHTIRCLASYRNFCSVVGHQNRCVDLLYFVLAVLLLLKQDTAPWAEGLGRTMRGQLTFGAIKPPAPLQVAEPPVSWDGHRWPELSW